jgi:hypothetical protein
MPLLRGRIGARSTAHRCIAIENQPTSFSNFSKRTDTRFYRSLRAVKVLLAPLRSTLTVLAPREERYLSVHAGVRFHQMQAADVQFPRLASRFLS